MSLKYEKPLIIPFDSDREETGFGDCVGGTGITGKCQDGVQATNHCWNGDIPTGQCKTGTGDV